VRSVRFTVAVAGLVLLAAATLALLEVGNALVHLLGAFFYVLSGGAP
jgi:hypothetical protein